MAGVRLGVRKARIWTERHTAMNADLSVARLAAGQQGMITTAQLLDAGLNKQAITRCVASGWLVRGYQGVYQLGVFPGPFGAEAAALLACGPAAVISHRTAAGYWRLIAREGPIDVSVPGSIGRKRDGIRPHRASLRDDEIVTRDGIRVTSPARTLLDLAASMPERQLDRLVEEAQVLGLVTRAELLQAVAAGARRPGVRKLAAIVGSPDEPAFTRSEAERRLVELVRQAGLARPRTNARIAGFEVDAVWPLDKLVVEVDGWSCHGSRQAFERDRRRDGRLLVAGYRVLRITWRQLTREPARVTAMLGAVLSPR
jgi:very-short-patch-repair endonuclease